MSTHITPRESGVLSFRTTNAQAAQVRDLASRGGLTVSAALGAIVSHALDHRLEVTGPRVQMPTSDRGNS